METNKPLYADIVLMALLFFALCSCTKDKAEKPAEPVFKLSGTITNNSDYGVRNVNIELYTSNNTNPIYTTKTNNDGEYQLSAIAEGRYTIKAIGHGYNESKTTVNINKDKTQNFIITGKATVNGIIINSQTGSGLTNVTIHFMRTSYSKEPTVEFVILTDRYGNFEIVGAAIGLFTITIEADGFFSKTIEDVSFIEGTNFIEQLTVTEQPEEGAYRIVLSWNANPYDLDSHLTGPNGSDRFHVYYGNPYYDDGNINLDVDDTYKSGPETITIREFTDGVYRYSVHNYNDQSIMGGLGIEKSPTKVEIYSHDGLVNTFIAPAFTGKGNTWRVFEMTASGRNISIEPINTYLQASTDNDMDTFLSENNNKLTIPYLMTEL